MSPYVYLIGAGVLVLLALVAVLAVIAGERIDVFDRPDYDDAPGSGRFGEAS